MMTRLAAATRKTARGKQLMNDQYDHVSKLLRDLASRVPAELYEEIVIFGSSAMILNGVRLERPVDDLDVFVSSKTFEELRALFDEKMKPATEGGSVPYIVIREKVEALKSFPGIEFGDALCRSQVLPNSKPFRVASLPHLRRWKEAQDRRKDRDDLKAIDQRLAELAKAG